MMKFTLVLFVILAIIGLAHQFSDFGKGPLHEDVQDILDLIPTAEIAVPNCHKSLEEEFLDFYNLLPAEKMVNVSLKYINEDKEVQNAVLFLFTSEFHDLLRALEALDEHKAIVVFLQKNTGLDIIGGIKKLHEAIGMEEYVPPKIESFLKAQIKAYEVGGGTKALLKELYSLRPEKEIDALFEEKRKNCKVFAHFIEQITSPEFGKLATNLAANKAYVEFITKSKEQGLDIVEFTKFWNSLVGLKF